MREYYPNIRVRKSEYQKISVRFQDLHFQILQFQNLPEPNLS